jgi:hypothetical protein
MIKTKIDERFKLAKKYKVSKKVLNKNTKEVFADLFYSENENYSLLYSLLEDIEIAIYHKECKEVGEIRDFIRKYKDTYVYPKCEFDLDD